MAGRKIIWSHKANIKLFEVLDFYTKRNGNSKYSVKLYGKFKKALALLNRNPDMGLKTDLNSVRGVIVENFILFYEVTSENIIVHTLWDSRRNPDLLKIDEQG